MKNTAIVILNWNGLKFLQQFLPNVVKHSESHASVWIVDNASTDDSVQWIKSEFPQVHVVQNDENYGFARGYNEGLKSIDAKTYVLLNSDVQVSANWILPVLEAMDKSNFVACQPKILSYAEPTKFEHAGAAGGFLDKNGYPFCRGRLFWEVENDEGQYDSQREIFWASGACLFIRSEIYHNLGGLDADFFAHMEEIDLCWRIKNRGYKIGYTPDSTVFHVGGGTLSMMNPFKTYLNFRNNLFMLVKNYRSGSLFLKILQRLALDGIAAIRFLTEAKVSGFVSVFKSHMAFYSKLGTMLKRRKAENDFVHQSNMAGWYSRSLLIDFMLKGKKKFRDLNQDSIKG